MSRVTGLVFDSERSLRTEPSATVLADMSRFGNDGAFLGDGEPDWVQLPSGLWVMDFDGVDDYISIPASSFVYPQGTITMWFNREGASAGGLLHLYEVASTDYLRIHTDDEVVDGVTLFIEDDNATLAYLYSPADEFPVANWWCLDITQNGTTIKMFKNGQEIATVDYTGWMSHLSPVVFSIGKSVWWKFDGLIALVRIYNRALSAGQIKNIFESERWMFGV